MVGHHMDMINEAARETPIIRKTDVLVVGSGPGGLLVTYIC